jgi:hypothetical protein
LWRNTQVGESARLRLNPQQREKEHDIAWKSYAAKHACFARKISRCSENLCIQTRKDFLQMTTIILVDKVSQGACLPG